MSSTRAPFRRIPSFFLGLVLGILLALNFGQKLPPLFYRHYESKEGTLPILPQPRADPNLLSPLPAAARTSLKLAISRYNKNRDSYGNKADFPALKRLLGIAKTCGFCNTTNGTPKMTVLVGGTNEGQGAGNILDGCDVVTMYGFEIQKGPYQIAKAALEARSPWAKVLNLGWDEGRRENVHIGGIGSTAGLYDRQGQRNGKLQSETASTVALSEWTDENNVDPVFFVLIDTEGHEPKVIRGMHLEKPANQKRFSMFQYELGGTWAARDVRHGNDPWDQHAAAKFLIQHGYHLFLVGTDDWLYITADFFANNPDSKNPAMMNEGSGPFVQGNLLAVHSTYVDPRVRSEIYKHVYVAPIESNNV